MDAVILKPLDALETALNGLVSSLTTTNTFANAPNTAKDLVSADDALSSALTTLKQHQDNHARILTLRTEANRLQDQIKSVVKTCVELRSEIGRVDPHILEYSDDDEDEGSGTNYPEVDYTTLLNFAARIGKHNATAAKEAEQESLRRRAEARKKAEEDAKAISNGSINTARDVETGDATEGNTTQESQAELANIDHAVSAQRAAMGMAFPAGELLRLGALGQLQLLREQQGELAVDSEIERLVRGSEAVQEKQDVDTEMKTVEPEEEEPKAVPPSKEEPTAQQQAPVSSQTQVRPPGPPAAARRKLELDFPGSDDDDDDDD